MFSKLRDPVSAVSHYIGAALSALAIVVVSLSRVFGFNVKTVDLVSTLIFTVSMFLLYLASGLYHSFKMPKQKLLILRKLDHSMIYILIAGSYTPFLLAMSNKKLGITLLVVMWTLALGGVLLKIFYFNLPRVVSTLLYIGLGWMVVFFIKDLKDILPPFALALLIIGGISYSIGGIKYILKKPSFKHVDFHDIFHFFILGGTAAQFFAVYFGILVA